MADEFTREPELAPADVDALARRLQGRFSADLESGRVSYKTTLYDPPETTLGCPPLAEMDKFPSRGLGRIFNLAVR